MDFLDELNGRWEDAYEDAREESTNDMHDLRFPEFSDLTDDQRQRLSDAWQSAIDAALDRFYGSAQEIVR